MIRNNRFVHKISHRISLLTNVKMIDWCYEFNLQRERKAKMINKKVANYFPFQIVNSNKILEEVEEQ